MIRNSSLATAIIILLISISLSIQCDPPFCDRPDCGTCGNACCNLQFFLRAEAAELNARISQALNSTGPDSLYTFTTSEDLRPYNISAQFILQGIHTTRVKHYNDTLNFAIYNNDGYYRTKLTAFSISQIGGALCDYGQNYNNLKQLISGLNIDYGENTLFGCPAKP